MNSLASHIEYLLRSHDCVVLPRWGAFLCNYTSARLSDVVEHSLLPPSRSLVFNNHIVESDGLLANSVSRREGISFDAAVRKVEAEASMMRSRLEADGELALGRLGIFRLNQEGTAVFYPSELPSINGPYFGLRPLALTPVEKQPTLAPVAPAVTEAPTPAPVVLPTPEPWHRRWRGYATGAVASIAVIVTAAMLILSPIHFDKPTDTAGIAPIPQFTATVTQEPTQVREAAQGRGGSLQSKANSSIASSPQQETTQPTLQPTTPMVKCAEPVEEQAEPAKEITEVAPTQSATSPRFNTDDTFCVIVASFPSQVQAQKYIDSNPGRQLDILVKDGKFRVYAATGASYKAAQEQRALIPQSDAWICRR